MHFLTGTPLFAELTMIAVTLEAMMAGSVSVIAIDRGVYHRDEDL